MEAAPGAPVPSRPLDLAGEVSAICSEWARTAGVALGGDSRLQVRLPTEPVGGLFDPDHLRRVLVNLLENGLRHAGRAAGAVQVSIEPVGPSLVRLCVASDGEPIAAEVEAHLFEPFNRLGAERTGVDDVQTFTAAVIQADQLGVRAIESGSRTGSMMRGSTPQ